MGLWLAMISSAAPDKQCKPHRRFGPVTPIVIDSRESWSFLVSHDLFVLLGGWANSDFQIISFSFPFFFIFFPFSSLAYEENTTYSRLFLLCPGLL